MPPNAGFPRGKASVRQETECGGAAFAARRIVFKSARERGHRLQQYDEYGEPVYCSRCEIDEPRLSSSAFWKNRGGLTSYSDLQKDFFSKISCKYGAVRGESKSLLKNTNAGQAQRFARANSDLYDEPPPFDDMPF